MEATVNSMPLEELQSKLKQKFPELRDYDLLPDETSLKDMLQLICYRLRKTKDEMLHIINFL
jgi:hypothetical protein